MLKDSPNLKFWNEYGESLLVVQPFMDSVIVGGEGCYLIDADGQRILDLAAGQFCSVLGHSHPRFVAKLEAQLKKIVHLGDQYVSPEVMSTAKRLAQIAPGDLNKVLLLSTGSEANECAMRVAKAVTGRTGMLAFTRGYYGISLATRNLSSISDHPGKADFQPAPVGQHKLLAPACNHCPIALEHPSCNSACLDVSLDMISPHLENIAAIIIEPILSAGGMIFPTTDYLQKLYATAKNIGALFIVDEAQTGFGRCGRWFDIENHGIVPDLMVVSKTAGNGYPAAAIVVSDRVARQLEAQSFTHLSSHQNDPLTAAAVGAVMEVVEEENLIENSRQSGAYFLDRLQSLQSKHPVIADVRGRGLMIGVELDGDLAKTESRPIAYEMAMLCERRGVHVTFSYYEPVIRIIPPLILSRREIDQAIGVMDESLTVLNSEKTRIDSIGPQNVRSGPFTRQMNQKISPVKMLRKMWRTSPQQWVEKLRSVL